MLVSCSTCEGLHCSTLALSRLSKPLDQRPSSAEGSTKPRATAFRSLRPVNSLVGLARLKPLSLLTTYGFPMPTSSAARTPLPPVGSFPDSCACTADIYVPLSSVGSGWWPPLPTVTPTSAVLLLQAPWLTLTAPALLPSCREGINNVASYACF